MNSIPQVSALLFSTITTALDNLGVSSERVVEKAGLPLWQFHEPQARVPGTHFFGLLGHCARTFGEETFGLRAVPASPISSLGSLGSKISQSQTTYGAIKTATELVPRFQNTSAFSTVYDTGELWWYRKRVQVADSGYRQAELQTLLYMIEIVRLGAGPDWRPAKICLEADSISGLDRTETFGNTEIRYGQELGGFAIPRSVLPRRIPTSKPLTAPSKDDGLLSEAPSGEFVESLRQVLRSFLFFGHPQIETFAEIAGLNVRTLQRRLAAEGLTFKRIIDQTRFQAAADLMGEPDVKLVEVAHDLGYADQAHFNRAFRRWAGVSPGEYRLHQQSL